MEEEVSLPNFVNKDSIGLRMLYSFWRSEISSDVNEIYHFISAESFSRGLLSYVAASRKVSKRKQSVHLPTKVGKDNSI